VYRTSPGRKYGPLALLAAAQLVVVLVAPSTAPTSGTNSVAAGAPAPGTAGAAPGTVFADGSMVAADGSIVAADGTVVSPAGDTSGSTTTNRGTTGAGTSAGAPVTSGSTGTKTAAVAAGDTSHCKNGRQFDPAIDFFAPPCAPGKPGATGVNNGGATSLGVTKDKITIVHYIPKIGPELEAILRAQGLYYDATNARIANAAFQKFMNKTYQFYGRKLDFRTFQGTCNVVPPDQPCLIAEMSRLAQEFKPYAVFFQTTVCSACFGELARNKVISFGGFGFSEEFRQALKPYNYDYTMSSTKVATLFAEWWCGSLADKNATYAGAQNPAQDFRTRKRQLGVVSPNDPDNKRVVKEVLYPALAKCGESVSGHEYFYEQNVNTAAQQFQAGTANMNTQQNPATSVVCLCDAVAPQFLYNAFKRNNYWPEVLLASNQSMDTDAPAQSYMADFACPPPGDGCSFDGALGLGAAEASVPAEKLSGVRVFKANSTSAVPLPPTVMDAWWQNYNMLGSLIQSAGPNLTPANMAAAATRLGSRGGGTTGFSRRAFEKGELSWTQDVFVTYWTKNKKSPFNGELGAFTQAYGGKRFGLGQIPKGDPAVPTFDKRA
jgi:hypothetical protein